MMVKRLRASGRRSVARDKVKSIEIHHLAPRSTTSTLQANFTGVEELGTEEQIYAA